MAEAGPMVRRIGRLAPEATNFVGRHRELGEIRRLLSESRLITLTGPGGVGKTRLAVRVAGQVWRAFADGVWQVELAGLSNASLLEYSLSGDHERAARLTGAAHRAWRDLGRAGYGSRFLQERIGLVAQGLSNKQISARLVISQRTAESHVENILRKLGFSSRAQVARWVAQHPPPGPAQ